MLKVGAERESKSNNWRGGKHTNTQGYVLVYCPEHPYCNSSGYVREHRIIMERKLKRFLNPEERVHHINKNKSDNRVENLLIFKTDLEHRTSVPHRAAKFLWKNNKNYNREYYLKNRNLILQKLKEKRKGLLSI